MAINFSFKIGEIGLFVFIRHPGIRKRSIGWSGYIV